MMLHHDEDEAIRRGIEGANFFGYSLGHFYVFGEHQPGETDVWARVRRAPRRAGLRPRGRRRGRTRASALGAKLAAGDTTGLRGSVGTPDQVREYLRRYEEAGVDQVIFVLQAGRNRHEHIMESIEMFGREVLPEFIERDEAQVAGQAAAVGAGDRGGNAAPRRGLPTRRRRRLLVPGLAGAVGQGNRLDRVGGNAAAVGRRPCRRQARSQRRHHRLTDT